MRPIDDDLWEWVQARFIAAAAPHDTPGGPTRLWRQDRLRHPLSGRLVCGACVAHYTANAATRSTCNQAPRGLCDNLVTVQRAPLEERVLAILAGNMMDPDIAQAFTEAFAAEWNLRAGQQHLGDAHLLRDLDSAERKLANPRDIMADGLRSPALQTKLSSAEA